MPGLFLSLLLPINLFANLWLPSLFLFVFATICFPFFLSIINDM